MTSRLILVIRHAEIAETPPPLTVDQDGRPDPFGLLPRGWQRAGALLQLFAPTGGRRHPLLARPTQLIAPARGDTEPRKARLMQATLTPLSRLRNIGIDATLGEEDVEALAQHVMASSAATVLICWGHTFIPTLAEHIAPTSAGHQIPAHWPDDRLDLVWSFERDDTTDRYGFAQVPQLLLDGDRDQPIVP